MALQSEVAPPVVGEANRDTFDGDTKSDESDTEEEDLEEGEILDSGGEQEEAPAAEPVPEAAPPEEPKAVADGESTNDTPSEKSNDLPQMEEKKHKRLSRTGERRSSRRPSKKTKHAENEEATEEEDDSDADSDLARERYYRRSSSKKHRDLPDGIIDYAKELAEYRGGSDQNSPDRRGDRSEKASKRKLKESVSSRKLHSKKSSDESPAKRMLKRKVLADKKAKYQKSSRKICKYFQEGNCSKGSDCPYIHPSPKKKELCRYYISGFCSKRRLCPYMHEEFPCKFYHTGAKCYAGENCRFSHDPLNEETERLLKECLKGGNNSHEDHRDSNRNKKRRSKSPEPTAPKRKCLLGSPPRHIREAEETKHWQEQMKRLQHEKGTDAFHITIDPSEENLEEYLASEDYDYRDNTQSPPQGLLMQPERPESSDSPPPSLMGPGFPVTSSPSHHGPQNFPSAAPNSQDQPNFSSPGPLPPPPPRHMQPGYGPPPVRPPFRPPGPAQMRMDFPPMGPMPPQQQHNQEFNNLRPPAQQQQQQQQQQPMPRMPQEFSLMGPAVHVQQAFGPRPPPYRLQPPFAPPPAGTSPQENASAAEQAIHDQDMRLNVDWQNIRALVDMMSAKHGEAGPGPQGKDPSQRGSHDSFTDAEPRSRNVVDEIFSPTRDGRECENKPDSDPVDQDWDSDEGCSSSSTAAAAANSAQSPAHVPEAAEPESFSIPSHLPRKQRELLMRIQKHQKLKAAAKSDDPSSNNDGDSSDKADAPESSKPASEDQTAENEVLETPLEKDSYSSSSEDDDEDTDKPLTEVLKKLQETPPPKPKENTPAASLQNINVSQIMSNIIQKANMNRSNNQPQDNEFWKNIIFGTTQSGQTPEATSAASVTRDSSRDQCVRSDQKTVERPPVTAAPAVRDPRLKNRPAPPASQAKTVVPNSVGNGIPPILPLETRMANHREITPVIISQTPAVVVDGLAANVPYRLHNVSTKPLNYAPYLLASHSDPKLLNDPRLRRHMTQSTAAVAADPSQPTKEKNVNSTSSPLPGSLPELPLFSHLKIHKNEGYSVPSQETILSAASPPILDRPTLPDIKLPPLQPQQAQKYVDPRTRRPDPRRLAGSHTPPHAPSVAETSQPSQPVPSRTTTTPTLASHLPRAISDPRMAKLHHPVDPRRSRIVPDSASRVNSVLQPSKQSQEVAQEPKLAPAESPAAATKSESEKPESEPEKSEDKTKKQSKEANRKDVLRNRKSSMEYASPLNSCDDSNSGSSLNYNSYNQRPKKQLPLLLAEGNAPKDLLPSSSVISALTLDLAPEKIQNTNLDDITDQASNASLKDMFKTIDPTASPFC